MNRQVIMKTFLFGLQVHVIRRRILRMNATTWPAFGCYGRPM